MKRKLIVQEWLSADGFAADEKGLTDFFSSVAVDEESDKDILSDMDHIDTILLGANTYHLFAGYWPTENSANDIIADKINGTRKIIFSNSLEASPWGKWDNAKLQRGDAIQSIAALKEQQGQDLVLWGSLSLTRSLLAAKLIDELEIRTCPIILGKGIKLFGESDEIKLQTTKVKAYGSGITLNRYSLVY
jgi:dihydrofolate reductase